MLKAKKIEEDSGYRNTITYSDEKGKTQRKQMDYGAGADHSKFHDGVKKVFEEDETKGKGKKK